MEYDKLLKWDGSHYKHYAAFYKNMKKSKINEPLKNIKYNFYKNILKTKYDIEIEKMYEKERNEYIPKGGRTEC